MTISLYAITVPVLTRYLTNLDAILAKAEANAAERKIEPEVLPNARLAPDMLPLSFQIQSTTDRAKLLLARLSGQTAPSWEDNETTLEQLRARVRKALDYVATYTEADLDGREGLTLTIRDRQAQALEYTLTNALPQFFFHVSMAYAILRENGVPIGKGDFVGA